MKRVLTVAGSDSGGGAGIQADLLTFAAFDVHGLTAVTAVTAQDSTGVHGVWPLPPEAVATQVRTVLGDIGADAVKVGMLATAGIAAAVADALAAVTVPIVVDPVLVSTSGQSLLDDLDVLRSRLVPLATVLTPNRDEDVRLGVRAAWTLVTDESGVDVLWHDGEATEYAGRHIATRHTHGSGCTLSAAIAARLAYGDDVPSAVRAAKDYVTKAIEGAYPLGAGRGTLRRRG